MLTLLVPFSCRRGAASALVVTLALGALLITACSRQPASGGDSKSATTVAPKSGAPAGAAEAKKTADAEKEKARQAAAELVPVETALAARGAISAFLSFNSSLETEAAVDIFPQISGQVQSLLVEEGSIVKKDESLLRIDDRELRADADEGLANFKHQQEAFARIEDLFKRNLVNKQEYEDARYQLDQMRIRHERAQLKLSYATVIAPFAGVISSRDTQVGATVGPASKLFSMVKLDEIVARVFVPGRYLSVVAENQPAVVTSEFLPDRLFKGWVKRISPVIDPKSGTFKVTVGVRSDKPSDLPPGLFVGVRIVTDTRPQAVLIPKRAVVYEGGERYIFVIAKDRAVKRKLAAGYEDPQNIECVSGLEPGTPVIVLGQAGLKDGAGVRVVNAGPAVAVEPAKASTEAAKPDKS